MRHLAKVKKATYRLAATGLTIGLLAMTNSIRAQDRAAGVLPLSSVQGIKPTMDASPTRTLEVVPGENQKSALRFGGTSLDKEGNRYFGVMIPLGRTWDFSKARVAFDARTSQPENTKALYFRAYNQGEAKASLSFAAWDGRLTTDWKTFYFQTGGVGSDLNWEAAVVENRVPDKVDRIEIIIGTSEKNAPIDVTLANLRTLPPLTSLADLSTPKTLQRVIPIAGDAQTQAVILHPDSQAGKAAAQKIADAVQRKTGVKLTPRAATIADREFSNNAILLGNATNNPALFLLYTRRFTPVDMICPGPGGALLQTIHDPFGKGAGAIVVGASDDAGLEKATAQLVAKIEKSPAGKILSFERFFEPDYSPVFLKAYPWANQKNSEKRLEDGLKAGRTALEQGKHTSIAGELRTAAQRYQLTGNDVEARLYVQLWEMYEKSAVPDASQYGGAWGFDSDFPSYEVVSGWDNIEEDPAVTNAQRLAVTRAMTRWLQEAVAPKASFTRGRVVFNHQTFPALGVLRAGLYFSQGYSDALEGPKWLAQADGVFKNQVQFFKPYEDCNTYQWLTDGHVITYSVARPDFTVFENNNALRIADYCIATMNNLGYQVPYGDTGVWSGSSSENRPLSVIAAMTKNPNVRWVSQLKNALRPGTLLYSFSVPVTESVDEFLASGAPEAKTFTGVQMWPLDDGYAATFPAENRPAENRLFDKVSFRSGFDQQTPYLLLDGLSNGGHGHYDGNSIEQLTQFDRIWLADNDYFKSHVKYHNALQILRNGEASQLPPYAALLGHGETNDFAYSHTQMANYSGTDWDRMVFYLKKSDAFLVLDKVTAQSDGEYQLRALWHGVGEATLSEDGMLLRQKGPSLWFQMARGPQLHLTNDEDLGKNWSSYPHAPAVVRSMSATARTQLKKGEHYLFATVFHGSKNSDVPAWKINFTQGYNGVALQNGKDEIRVQMEDGRIQVGSTPAENTPAESTPGLTTFNESGSNAPSKSDFAANKKLQTALAPPPQNLREQTSAPQFKMLWSLTPAPDELLLTGNAGQPGALKKQATLTVDPVPQKKGNVLNSDGDNNVRALLDGQIDTGGQAVMFPVDRAVTVTLDLHHAAQISQVGWQQWWAKTSSRQTAYLLKNARVELSNDNFQNDIRALGEIAGGQHPDWGTPISYEMDGKNQVARYVRLTLTPQPGSAIYLAEIQVRGKMKNAEVAGAASHFSALATAQLQKGAPRTLLATTREGGLLWVSPEGKMLKRLDFASALNDVAAGDVNGDGVDEIAIARQDGNTTLLDAGGNELWSRKLQYYRRPPYVNLVRMGDLNGDGKDEVISGAENWRFYAYDGTGKQLWQYETVHPSRSGAIADLDGDGKKEVVAGTHYYTSTVLSDEGKRVWSYRLGPIAYDIAVGNFDGDKTRGVVFGAGDGFIHYADSKGQPRLKFNTGDEVRHVATADLDGDGRDEIFAASDNSYLYCIGADAKVRWAHHLDSPATALTAASAGSTPSVTVGTRDGQLLAFNAKGELIRQTALGSSVTQLLAQGNALFVATDGGQLLRVEQ
jgi:hypothetical protein